MVEIYLTKEKEQEINHLLNENWFSFSSINPIQKRIKYIFSKRKNKMSTYHQIREILVKCGIIAKKNNCEICNAKEYLIIHEKNYFLSNIFSQDNYSTLCYRCHSKYSKHKRIDNEKIMEIIGDFNNRFYKED